MTCTADSRPSIPELIRISKDGSIAQFERAVLRYAQYPDDLLRLITLLAEAQDGELTFSQNWGFCNAFEQFGPALIARALASATGPDKHATSHLDVTTHGKAKLKEGIRLFESGEAAPLEPRFGRFLDSTHERLTEALASGSPADIERAAARCAQLPDDLLALLESIVAAQPRKRFSTRQKKGLCRAFEHYGMTAIARAIDTASRRTRRSLNYLSVERFGGPKLKEAISLSGRVEMLPWEREVSQRLEAIRQLWSGSSPSEQERLLRYHELFEALGERPRELLLALPRVTCELGSVPKESGEDILTYCSDLPATDVLGALATISAGKTGLHVLPSRKHGICLGGPWRQFGKQNAIPSECRMEPHATLSPKLVRWIALKDLGDPRENEENWKNADPEFTRLVREGIRSGYEWDHFWARHKFSTPVQKLLRDRLAKIDTPLRGKRVHLGTGSIALDRSVVVTDRWGYAGGTWPPSGMAFELPERGIVRIAASWTSADTMHDAATVPFLATNRHGKRLHDPIADAWKWTDSFDWTVHDREYGSGLFGGEEVRGREHLKYLQVDLDVARRRGIGYVVMGRCVDASAPRKRLNRNVIANVRVLGDPLDESPDTRPRLLALNDVDLEVGDSPGTIAIDVQRGYLQVLRSTEVLVGGLEFSMRDYLFALFDAQGATLVDNPDEAEAHACIGPSSDPSVVSLFDNRFFI